MREGERESERLWLLYCMLISIRHLYYDINSAELALEKMLRFTHPLMSPQLLGYLSLLATCLQDSGRALSSSSFCTNRVEIVCIRLLVAQFSTKLSSSIRGRAIRKFTSHVLSGWCLGLDQMYKFLSDSSDTREGICMRAGTKNDCY